MGSWPGHRANAVRAPCRPAAVGGLQSLGRQKIGLAPLPKHRLGTARAESGEVTVVKRNQDRLGRRIQKWRRESQR